MLYKSIYIVGLYACGFSSTYKITEGALYIRYSNSSIATCADAGPSDECEFYCNIDNWGQSIHCGSANICKIYPEEKKCFKDAIINASSAATLYVYPGSVGQPYSGATFHVPSSISGRAFFENDAASNGPYQAITVEAGANTRKITLNNQQKDDWKKSTINAQSAKILRILSSGATFNGRDIDNPTVINCPQYSDYVDDVYKAPCYIDVASGGSLESVIINTLYGKPHDVDIQIDDMKDVADVQLTCSAIVNFGVWDTDIFDTDSACFNSKTPTLSPTKAPTRIPTKPPTQMPSVSPTKTPTKPPTKVPTDNPTKSPTKVPTDNPTKTPTKTPTQTPSMNPTASPTKYPSVHPIKVDSKEIMDTTSSTHDVESSLDSNGSVSILGGDVNHTLSIILYSLIGLVVCTVFGFCLWWMKRRRDRNIERALSLSQAARESRVKKKNTLDSGTYQDADNNDKIEALAYNNTYSAHADTAIHQAEIQFEEGDGDEVVIKVSPKMKAFSSGNIAAEYNDFVNVGSINIANSEPKAMNLAHEEDMEDVMKVIEDDMKVIDDDMKVLEDDMKVIEDVHVTAGDHDEDLVESNSGGHTDDDDVIVGVTQGY